ncbi:hypothetical protein BDR22DRAFT_800435 [Usnea florida]
MTATPPSRSMFTRPFTKRNDVDAPDAQYPKGPLGLTTLYEPSGPAIADLVFVHGLGGGSRSTWTHSSDTSLFWPQEWLPTDAGFRHVRIHSFGYNSNWKKESVLNIHDFSKALLGSLSDCPTIPRDSTTPIVFIGHSMGGLVIKKAYTLAQQFQEFESIAERVRAIFFLATPHRGSDLAALLSRILHVAHGARPFVQDLHRNSLATQSINDEFSHCCQKLQLFSFYETLPINYIIGRGLVVDKDLAVLGYSNERTAYMHANHRDICKYPDQSDPNYQTIRNALAFVVDIISADDTKSDILKYLNENIHFLPTVDEGGHQSTIIKIIDKSAGCFLWVKLVLEELRHVHTSAEVHQVLEEVPSDMDELYTRILNSMSKAPYGKALTKAILTWTVCSARPLTTQELYYALQLDINDSIDTIEKTIIASCGQLVYIDSRSCVHMVHQTARNFLLQSNVDSEFQIDKRAGHKRLLMTCLRYLFKFLKSSNILSWIEHLAEVSDLACIIQTGRTLQNYLQRRSTSVSPIGKDTATLDSWTTDLIRLVAKFGKTMSASPASIHHLIPPFCPPESAPRKQFAAATRGITVLGLSATSWDDCLSTIVRPSEQLTAVACCDIYFAIGSSNGKFAVYNEMTCQEIQELDHSEPIRMLKFGATGSVIASSGMKSIRLWDVESWQQLWQQDIPRDCLSLCFADEDRLLLGALRNNELMFWECASGLLTDVADWTENDDGQQNHAYRRPTTAAVCAESSLLAVVYRGQDILIWDIESNSLYDTYAKETGSSRNPSTNSNVKAFVTGGLVFSTDPSTTLLAASYSDGDLVLFETTEGIVKEKTLANAQILASSPNGRTLAAADSAGRIQIFDFETLRLLHCISADDYGTKALTFSGDNSRLLDIRGSECRVWDPTALLRPDEVDENSDTVSVLTLPQETLIETTDDTISISALACDGNGEAIFCGKNDGGVYLYHSSSGSEIEKLISHASNVPVVSLYFDNQSSVLSSVDSSSRVMVHKMIPQENKWRASRPSFDHRVGVAVTQVLSNKGATQVLVSSNSKDVLYSLSEDGSSSFTNTEIVEDLPHRWANHPLNPDQLVFMSNAAIHLYEWKTLRRLTASDSLSREDKMLSQLSTDHLTTCGQGRYLAATFSESSASRYRPRKLLLWRTSDFSVQSSPTTLLSSYRILADQMRCVIGAHRQRLVFLDSNGWVCSADVGGGTPNDDRYTRHFFIPTDWLSAAGTNLMIDMTCSGDIIFVKRHEIAVIKRGLETSEQGPGATGGARSPIRGASRPSLASARSSGSDDKFLRPRPERKRPSLPVGMDKASEDIFP